MANKQPDLAGNGRIHFRDSGTLAFINSILGRLTLQSGGTNEHLDVYTTGTGVFRVNGNPLAPSAYTDTTNASNITTGTLPAAQIPASVKPPTGFTQPAKTFNTIYQNLTGKVMYVNISFTVPNSVPARVYSDPNPSPVSQLMMILSPTSGGSVFNFFFLVLPNHYYKLVPDSGAITIQLWTEWV